MEDKEFFFFKIILALIAYAVIVNTFYIPLQFPSPPSNTTNNITYPFQLFFVPYYPAVGLVFLIIVVVVLFVHPKK